MAMQGLDGKSAQRMRAASRALAQRRAEEQAKAQAVSQRTHTRALKRKLEAASLPSKGKQPERIIRALDAVPDAQTARIVDVRQQDARGESNATQAAVVTSLPVALKHLPDDAREGLEAFAALYWDAQPSQAMSYEPRVRGNDEGDGVNHAYDRLDAVRRTLERVGGRTGRKVYDRAVEIVSSPHDRPYDGVAVGLASYTGRCLAALFARAE